MNVIVKPTAFRKTLEDAREEAARAVSPPARPRQRGRVARPARGASGPGSGGVVRARKAPETIARRRRPQGSSFEDALRAAVERFAAELVPALQRRAVAELAERLR